LLVDTSDALSNRNGNILVLRLNQTTGAV